MSIWMGWDCIRYSAIATIESVELLLSPVCAPIERVGDRPFGVSRRFRFSQKSHGTRVGTMMLYWSRPSSKRELIAKRTEFVSRLSRAYRLLGNVDKLAQSGLRRENCFARGTERNGVRTVGCPISRCVYAPVSADRDQFAHEGRPLRDIGIPGFVGARAQNGRRSAVPLQTPICLRCMDAGDPLRRLSQVDLNLGAPSLAVPFEPRYPRSTSGVDRLSLSAAGSITNHNSETRTCVRLGPFLGARNRYWSVDFARAIVKFHPREIIVSRNQGQASRSGGDHQPVERYHESLLWQFLFLQLRDALESLQFLSDEVSQELHADPDGLVACYTTVLQVVRDFGHGMKLILPCLRLSGNTKATAVIESTSTVLGELLKSVHKELRLRQGKVPVRERARLTDRVCKTRLDNAVSLLEKSVRQLKSEFSFVEERVPRRQRSRLLKSIVDQRYALQLISRKP